MFPYVRENYTIKREFHDHQSIDWWNSLFKTLTKSQQRIITIIKHYPGITVSELVKMTRLNKRVLQYNIRKLRDQMIIWKVGNGRSTSYEYVTKEKFRNEVFKLLIKKFLRNEIDEETYFFLKRKLKKESY